MVRGFGVAVSWEWGCVTIGSVHVDVHKRAKALGQQYPLHTPDGVRTLLRNIHRLRIERIRGDIDAATLLMDFMAAYRRTVLSDQETNVLYYRFETQMNQRETAKMLDISRQTVSNYEERAFEKIAKTFADMGAA